MQLRAVASPEWGPEREKLRAFCVALVQAKMCYGVTVVRCLAVGSRAAGQGAGTGGTRSGGYSKAANREDALREARLKPINEAVHRRALEHYFA
ncbi:hypothetical protein ERJ75_001507300 [Trypanosoma vivax]|nr:hypothetical protein ERJ75_001507300 [Trypanosoma vivax]